jgi:hypothetical protein
MGKRGSFGKDGYVDLLGSCSSIKNIVNDNYFVDSRIHYYYLRDENRRPVITVAVADILDDGVVCRGVAICSDKELPVKRIGRDIARGRLIKALVNREDSEPVQRFEAVDVMMCEDLYTDFKSSYDVEPTEFELGLLDPEFRVVEDLDDPDDSYEDVYKPYEELYDDKSASEDYDYNGY